MGDITMESIHDPKPGALCVNSGNLILNKSFELLALVSLVEKW